MIKGLPSSMVTGSFGRPEKFVGPEKPTPNPSGRAIPSYVDLGFDRFQWFEKNYR
jgi:hypothetical protein